MQESLILVDEFGNRTGTAGRGDCHLGQGVRHRAFVTFLSDPAGRLLIQKRQGSKLGGGRWDVSATSHVRSNETFAAAIRRCLSHELGIADGLVPRYLLSYTYLEQLDGRAENEYCSLFVLPYDGPVVANLEELESYRWVSVSELLDWYRSDSVGFTLWFGEAFERMVRYPLRELSDG
ncbi:MAG: NUDIX domain-containing protein [gamma proteobacterium endosymbiont of Lamellibrachia anaximandri]|nr:NUDIX domain-containing protein [gamma proteobacterium endosymbiont of Lamellibrachia anaximandri]MBL3619023.1 NUDIX domain-containing protein [gamma proteobacterium endosymbiont of Lamellibrachia anaximandri]